MQRISPVSLLIGLLVGVSLLVGLVHFVGLDAENFGILAFSWPYLLAAMVLYVPSMVLRTLRMGALAPHEDVARVGMSRLALILTIQQAAAQWLPLRLGEFTYAALMKRQYGGTWSSRIGTTVLMRLSDLAALGLLVSIAGFLVASDYPGVWVLALGGLGVCSVSFLGILFGSRFLLWIMQVLPAVLRKKWESRYLPGLHGLDLARRSGNVSYSTALSIVLWINTMSILWTLAKGLGLSLSFPTMALAASGGIAASVLPFSPPANLGTSEAGWVATLVLVNIPPAEALVYAIGLHAGILGITGMFGIIALGSYVAFRPHGN